MEIYLIEVRNMDEDEEFYTIRRGVRGSLETAKSLVGELLEEYVRKGYTSSSVMRHGYEDGSFVMRWELWSNSSKEHDFDIVLSDGRMDTNEHRIWISNEDNGRGFENNEEMTEYIINNYEL